MKPISVNKRKPRSGKTVLVFVPKGISCTWCIGTWWNKKDSGGHEHWAVNDMEYGKEMIVTHWMNLPEAP